MKPKRIFYTLRTSMMSLGLIVSAWSQTAVTINNPGFEADGLADGGSGLSSDVPAVPADWAGGYNYAGDTTWFDDGGYSGAYNPGPTGDFGGMVPEETSAAWAESYAGYQLGLRQILSEVLLPSITYDLSVKVGNPDVTVGDAGYRVELFAGGTSIAVASGPAPTSGTWITVPINYVAPAAGDPLILQPLEIRLLAEDGPTGNRVHFDDVSLVRTTLTDPLADAGGPYIVSAGGSLSLDGSGSVPPDGGSITNYDWDLDNDGTYGDVTGANPSAISDADLLGTWGMSPGANTIKLRVTDSNTNTSIATTTVNVNVATPIAIPVPNFGFEDPAQGPGGEVEVPTGPTSWEGGYYTGSPASSWDAENGFRGARYPTTGQDYDATVGVPEGTQHAFVDIFGGYLMGLRQILDDTLQPDIYYGLTVQVGNPDITNGGGAASGCRIELFAGSTLIASADGPAPASGQWITVTTPVFQAPSAGDPLLNEALEIRIMSDASGTGTELHFDNVQLSRSPLANPVADAGGPYGVISPGGSLSLDGSSSLASGTGSITLYEWDLDDDGSYDDATGATPGPFTDAQLIANFGMAMGANTIGLKVTDSDAKAATTTGTVTLLEPITTYTGTSGSGGGDKWNVAGNWSAGVPAGVLDAVIPDQASAFTVAVTSSTVPPYSGNLQIGNNVTLQLGWVNGSQFAAVYNALGTPGSTMISMGDNSMIKNRNPRGGTTWTVPAVVLYGNATFKLKESTETSTSPTFPYPVTGSHTLTIDQQGIATFQAANSFDGLIASNGCTVVTEAAGTLGSGNVTATGTAKLTLGVTNSIDDSATLALSGTSGQLTLNVDETVDLLEVGGVPLPAGTYGRVGSPDTPAPGNEVSWIAGNETLTVTSGSSPFETWAGQGTMGTVTFGGDTNGDGVQDGMAFLLGVAHPDDDANGALPTVSESAGGLVMIFNCLPVDDRGGASLKVGHSNTLGSWTPTTNVVPDTNVPDPGGDVTYVVVPGSAGPPATNTVTATIDGGVAAGGKLFGRLEGGQ